MEHRWGRDIVKRLIPIFLIPLFLIPLVVRAQSWQPSALATSEPTKPTLIQTGAVQYTAVVNSPVQQCIYTFSAPIGRGHTLLGFTHQSNIHDTPVPSTATSPGTMFPQWVHDSVGNVYNLSAPAFWSPWPEYVNTFYLTNVRGNPTTITADFSQYPNAEPTILQGCNFGIAEYAGVTAVSPLVAPVSVDGTSPSITITPTAPSLIWTYASVEFEGVTTASQLTNSGYRVINNTLAADDTAVWQSNALVPAGALTLTWSRQHWNDSACQQFSTITHTCPAVLAAMAIR